jgi:hypothetical protein
MRVPVTEDTRWGWCLCCIARTGSQICGPFPGRRWRCLKHLWGGGSCEDTTSVARPAHGPAYQHRVSYLHSKRASEQFHFERASRSGISSFSLSILQRGLIHLREGRGLARAKSGCLTDITVTISKTEGSCYGAGKTRGRYHHANLTYIHSSPWVLHIRYNIQRCRWVHQRLCSGRSNGNMRNEPHCG